MNPNENQTKPANLQPPPSTKEIAAVVAESVNAAFKDAVIKAANLMEKQAPTLNLAVPPVNKRFAHVLARGLADALIEAGISPDAVSRAFTDASAGASRAAYEKAHAADANPDAL